MRSQRSQRSLVPAAALAVLLWLPLAHPAAAGEVQILYSADAMTTAVNLKPLEPLSPALRAVLAFYAMRANGGCPSGKPGGPKDSLQCPFTTALGLGEQCSAAQIALVKKYFKGGIPPLNLTREQAAEINRSGDLRRACNATSYNATHQSVWLEIRLQAMDRERVRILSRGSWTAGPEAGGGTFNDMTVYRLLPDRVEVVSHKGDVVKE
jgi:hypothetical protein